MAVPRHARTAFFPDDLSLNNNNNNKNKKLFRPLSPTLSQSTNGRILTIVDNYATDTSNDSTAVPPDFPSPPFQTVTVLSEHSKRTNPHRQLDPYPESVWSEDQRKVKTRQLNPKLNKALQLRHNPSIASMSEESSEENEQDLSGVHDSFHNDDDQRSHMRSLAREYMMRSPPPAQSGNSNTPLTLSQPYVPAIPKPVLTTRPLNDNPSPPPRPPRRDDDNNNRRPLPNRPPHEDIVIVSDDSSSTTTGVAPQRAHWFAQQHHDTMTHVPLTPPNSPTSNTLSSLPSFSFSRQHHQHKLQNQQHPLSRAVTFQDDHLSPQQQPRALLKRSYDHDEDPKETRNRVQAAMDMEMEMVKLPSWKNLRSSSSSSWVKIAALVLLALNVIVLDVLVVVWAVQVVPVVGKVVSTLKSIGVPV